MYSKDVTIHYDIPDNHDVHIQTDKDTDVLIRIMEGNYWVEINTPNDWKSLGKFTPQQLVDFVLPILFTGEYHEQD